MKIKELQLKSLGLPSVFDKLLSLVTCKKGNLWTIDENLVLTYEKDKSEEKAKLILAHEVLHLYLLHPFIETPKEVKLMHEVTDYLVNDILIYEFGLTELLKIAKYKTDKEGYTPCGVCVRNKSFVELFALMCKLRGKEVPTIVFKRKELNHFLKLMVK